MKTYKLLSSIDSKLLELNYLLNHQMKTESKMSPSGFESRCRYSVIVTIDTYNNRLRDCSEDSIAINTFITFPVEELIPIIKNKISVLEAEKKRLLALPLDSEDKKDIVAEVCKPLVLEKSEKETIISKVSKYFNLNILKK